MILCATPMLELRNCIFSHIMHLGCVVGMISSVKCNHAYLQSDKALVFYSRGSRFQYRPGEPRRRRHQFLKRQCILITWPDCQLERILLYPAEIKMRFTEQLQLRTSNLQYYPIF